MGLSFKQLLAIVKATNYGVFDRMPTMHEGGVVPGADTPTTAQEGEHVIPYGSEEWKRLRAEFLRENPGCEEDES